jgi:cytochrome c oxidase subunit 3
VTTYDNGNTISPELNKKMKKNLLRIFIFAVIMIFAGLTSGYVVSQGGRFWVNIKMPDAFKISTIAIILSSASLLLAQYAVKKDNNGLVKAGLGFAFIFGVLFGVYQFIGWGQLIDNGSTVSSSIMNTKGRYGKYYSLSYKGKEITYNNADFFYKGAEMTPELKAEMKTFANALLEGSAGLEDHVYTLSDYGTEFSLTYRNKLVTYLNNQFTVEGLRFSLNHHQRLNRFAENIANDRGDFIMKGKYGEDFVIYYAGDELEYSNRTFYRNGQQLSAMLLGKLADQRNTASSYIYAFTFVHLLHWIGGVIALLVMSIKGLQTRYSKSNYLGITLGSTYWHFLGILWLYLYAFLIFIH